MQKTRKEGIRCNAIAPGLVLSETAQASLDEDFMTQMREAHRSPRLGQPEDIAGAVAYLLSDDGAWINGQVWSVNGGISSATEPSRRWRRTYAEASEAQ